MIGWFMSQNIPGITNTNLSFIPFSLIWNPSFNDLDNISTQNGKTVLQLISLSFYLYGDSNLYTVSTDFSAYGQMLARFELSSLNIKKSTADSTYPIKLEYYSYIGIPSNKFISGISAKFKIQRESLYSNKYAFDFYDKETGSRVLKNLTVNSYNTAGGITNFDFSLFDNIDQLLNCQIKITSSGW